MAKAIFIKPFKYSSRKTAAGWSIDASDEPQHFPQEVIDAAIAKGVAIPAASTEAPPAESSGFSESEGERS